jgi:hypothetical protein
MSMTETVLEQDKQPLLADNGEATERAPQTTLSPEAALDRLRKGQSLENVCVERLCFQGEFPLPFTVRNCQLVKPKFEGATFHDDVAFVSCTIERPAFSRTVVFEKNCSLVHSTLVSAQLTRLTVKGGFDAGNVRTKGKFDLLNSNFEGPVRFWEADFGGWVDVKNCTFVGEVDFRSFHANHGFGVYKCVFQAPVLFRGASVALKCDLTGSRFESALDFSKAKLHDYVYLENIEQGPAQRFSFLNTVGERVLVDVRQLAGRLASEEAGDYDKAMHEYAFLKRSYSALHRYEQEDWAFYCFKVNQRRSCDRSWARPWTKLLQFFNWLFLDVGCHYCTNPFRAVTTALVIMFGFALVYMGWIEHLNADLAKLPFRGEELTSPANRVLIGVLTSVSVFTSGVGGIRDMATGWMNVPLIIESLLGTLLWGLFIVAFSRKVIR